MNPRFAKLAGAVLTGGASTRMGRPKERLEVGGVPAAARVVRSLAAVTADIVLVGGDPPADVPGRRVGDLPGPGCALRGLVTALSTCESEHVLVVAVDLPLVEPELLLALVAWPRADAVVASPSEGPQPLCALYRREPVLRAASERLATGRLSLRGLLEAIETRLLAGADLALADPSGCALLNVNTPEDLASAEECLARRSRRSESSGPPVTTGPG